MGRRVWFISDTHFGHDKIRDYCRPQFATLAEMEDCMITNWRETVAAEDLVYHLGDFARTTVDAARVRRQLTGTIRLIVGNHDDIPSLVAEHLFQKIQYWRLFDEYGFAATHVPLMRSQLRHGLRANVHGHVHGNLTGLDDFHFDLSVESIDYKPMAAEEIVDWISRDGPAVHDSSARTSV